MIGSFYLGICFGVINTTHFLFGAQNFEQGTPKLAYKLSTLITNNFFWQTM
jgi:hypothetical protein